MILLFSASIFLLLQLANRCSSSDRCKMPLMENVDYGMCPTVTRYYYNGSLNKCYPYIGCVSSTSTANDFDSVINCLDICLRPSKYDPLKEPRLGCSKLLDTSVNENGSCRSVPRFHFNAESGRCNKFLGCINNLNSNNFATLGDCRKECGEELIVVVQPTVVTNLSATKATAEASSENQSDNTETEMLLLGKAPDRVTIVIDLIFCLVLAWLCTLHSSCV